MFFILFLVSFVENTQAITERLPVRDISTFVFFRNRIVCWPRLCCAAWLFRLAMELIVGLVPSRSIFRSEISLGIDGERPGAVGDRSLVCVSVGCKHT